MLETEFKPTPRDSHDIRTLPKGFTPALSAASLVAIMLSSGACRSTESSAAPVEPTSTQQYDPTLKMETLPDPTEVGATFTPVPSPTSELTPTPTEVVVDVSGLEVFVNDPEQKEQVLEYVKFRDALNGCNGDVVCLREVDTGNEDMNSAMRLLADQGEDGEGINSIDLAHALKKAFPDLGLPELGKKIQETVMDVFRDICDPRMDPDGPWMITVMNYGDIPFKMANAPSVYDGTISFGPHEQHYLQLVSGSVIFRRNQEIMRNQEMDKLQIVLGRYIGVNGDIYLLVTEINEEEQMTMYISKDNEDELLTDTQWVIRDGYNGPNLFPQPGDEGWLEDEW